MFGYVKIFRNELKIKEETLYKRHYCRLCRSMGQYSEFSRIFLSYDITFFLMLGLADNNQDTDCDPCGILKCRTRAYDGAYDFFAAFGIALIYHKLNNDVIDGEVLKRVPRLLIKRAYKKTVNKYPEVGSNIEQGLSEIVKLEKNSCTDYKNMSLLFAKTISDACELYLSDYEDGKIILKIIEAVARCVYLIDIIDDAEKDFKKRQYNPLNLIAGGLARQNEKNECANLIFEILDSAVSLVDLLPYSENIPIISNILTLGIPFVVQKMI